MERRLGMMGGIARRGLPVFALLALISTAGCVQTPSSTKPETPQGETIRYEVVAEGVRVLRLWQIKGWARWPEIAILEFSPKWHDEFHADPAKFLNKYQIFSQPVGAGTGGGCAIAATEEPRPSPPETSWKAVVEHSQESGWS